MNFSTGAISAEMSGMKAEAGALSKNIALEKRLKLSLNTEPVRELETIEDNQKVKTIAFFSKEKFLPDKNTSGV